MPLLFSKGLKVKRRPFHLQGEVTAVSGTTSGN